MEKLERITINPNVCLGQPTIRNMRITVSFVIKMLASTRSIQATLEAYPELEAEDIQQALEASPLIGLFAGSPDIATKSEEILQQEITEKSGWTWK